MIRRALGRASEQNDARPRVVVQNGEYWLINNGDLAMLRVTLGRLRTRWPEARIGVLTSSPLLLRSRHPDAEPIGVRGRGRWPGFGLATRFAVRTGTRVCGPISTARSSLRDLPRQQLARLQQRLPGRVIRPIRRGRVPAALHGSSLLIVMGGGYLTDVDPDQAARTLDLLEAAADAGIPTAMVGQGIGPLEDEALRARARQVLPRVDRIALRERRRGPGLLGELDVPADRVRVTGDDAIELARTVRSDVLGCGIGVCLRIADYSPVARSATLAVRAAVQQAAHDHETALVPLIISEYRSEDRRSTLPLVDGYPKVVPTLGRYVAPEQVAARVGRCRVLVTGAYHLAVFALTQGIPVVGLSMSRYYDDKLLGLADMFEGGLTVVQLDEPDLQVRIAGAIADAWSAAPHVRRQLRERADEQVRASREAFEEVFALVDQVPPTGEGEPRTSTDSTGHRG